MKTMEYKGNLAKIEYSKEDHTFFGTIVNISRDRICFGGSTVKQLRKHLEEAIDGHIQNCKLLKIEPEKPYSGRITLRTSPEEHALFVEAALRTGNHSLNEWMNKVLLHEAEKRINYPSNHYRGQYGSHDSTNI